MTQVFRVSQAQSFGGFYKLMAVFLLALGGLTWAVRSDQMAILTALVWSLYLVAFAMAFAVRLLLKVVRADVEEDALVLYRLFGKGGRIALEDLDAVGTGAEDSVLFCTPDWAMRFPDVSCAQTGQSFGEALLAAPGCKGVVKIGAPEKVDIHDEEAFEEARRKAGRGYIALVLVLLMGAIAGIGMLIWGWMDGAVWLMAQGAALLSVGFFMKPFLRVQKPWIDRRGHQLGVTGPFGRGARALAFRDIFFVDRRTRTRNKHTFYQCVVWLGDGTQVTLEDDAEFTLAEELEAEMIAAH